MKNIKCLFGFHKYNEIEVQRAGFNGKLVDSFSGVPIERIVEKCDICGKVKYTSLILGISVYDKNIDWIESTHLK